MGDQTKKEQDQQKFELVDFAKEVADQVVEKSKLETAEKEKESQKKEEEKTHTAEDVKKAAEQAAQAAVQHIMEKQKEQKAEGAKNEGAGEPGNAPGFISGKYKLDQISQQILDGINSKNLPAHGLEIEVPFSVSEGEDRLRHLYKQAAREGRKADLDGATSYGAEITPETWGADLYMRMADMDGELMKYFPKVGMTSYKHHISELLTDITVSAYYSYQDQNLAVENATASSPTTGDLTLEGRTFIAKTNVYNRLVADSRVNLVRGIRQKMAQNITAKISSAILNGDTTATHMDEDFEAAGANIPEAMWKGFRRLTLDGSLNTTGALSLANLEAIERVMGKYALKALRSCLMIVGVKGYSRLKGLYRASATTPRAADFTLEKGIIEAWNGHPVVISDQQREVLDTDGKQYNTGTADDKGYLNLVQTAEFIMALRERMTIKIIPEPLKDRNVIVGMMLADFQPFETPSTTIPSVAGLIGWDA